MTHWNASCVTKELGSFLVSRLNAPSRSIYLSDFPDGLYHALAYDESNVTRDFRESMSAILQQCPSGNYEQNSRRDHCAIGIRAGELLLDGLLGRQSSPDVLLRCGWLMNFLIKMSNASISGSDTTGQRLQAQPTQPQLPYWKRGVNGPSAQLENRDHGDPDGFAECIRRAPFIGIVIDRRV